MKADIVILAKAMFRSLSRSETPSPGGVAVSGNRIAAAGNEDEIRAYIGEDTQVFEYGEDALLMPGFCDSHLHLNWTITAESGPQLRYVASEDECVVIVKKWVDEHPDAPWVVGNGWHQSNWPVKEPPDKAKLSAAIPGVPVCLMDVDCHAAWLNQKALDAFGITADTPDREGGVIYHYANGEPSGYIEENPCMNVYEMGEEANNADAARRKINLAHTCAAFNRRGITSCMDAMDTPRAWLGTIKELDGEGKYSLRLFCTAYLNGGDDYMERMRLVKDMFGDEDSLVKFWGFKGLLDGVGGTRTAWMTGDYADDPGNRGYPLIDPDTIKRRVLDVEEKGYGVHLHACGTRAVEYGLDMIEEAIKKGCARGARNAITHCDTVNDKDFARFGKLNVIAALQPEMLAPTMSYADNLYPIRFGEKLMENAWANRRFFDNANVVSFSSDSPVTITNPMYDIFRATQRVHNDGTPAGGIHPEQKVTLSECLWAFTYGGAYQLASEDRLGTLEAGKIADIAVLDHNIFTVKPEKYHGIESQLTIVDGKVVYKK
jgi:predicted amidohydrolase YtcJ